MAGPWEKFQAAAPAASEGPWQKFQAAPPSAPAEEQPSSWLDAKIPGGTPRQYIHAGLEALPTAGMMVGGAVGGTAGAAAMGVGAPVGAVAGAGLGAAAGASIRNYGEALLGEKKTLTDAVVDPVKEGLSGATMEGAGQIAGKGISAAASSKIGQAAIDKLGSGAAKVGELFTGVPKAEIETYAKHADEINKMSQASDGDVQEAANQLRSKFTKNIQKTRTALNTQISTALDKRTDQAIDAQPIFDALSAQKAKINPKLYPDQISHIDDLADKIGSLTQDGKLGLKDAQQVKSYLQDVATPAYGQSIMPAGKDVQRAAKGAAAVARQAIATEAPEIAQANADLSQLHQIQRNANKNLFTANKPAAALMSAGSGGNPQNVKMLSKLSDLTDTPMLEDAQKLSAMRTFGKPQLTPVDSTGKAVGRMGLGAGLGFVIGHAPGAVAGAALTSPAALKVAINSGQAIGQAGKAIASNPEVLGVLAKPFLKSDDSKDRTQEAAAPDVTPLAKAPATSQPKGKDKWAKDGLENLQDHVDDDENSDSKEIFQDKEALMKDPKIKDLLVAASDLKPGSKAMEKIAAKIKMKLDKEQS